MPDDVDPFPFADVNDLRARWPGVPQDQDAYIEILLEDASQYILDVYPTAKDASPKTRKRIVCAVVRRSIQAELDGSLTGLESMQMSAGPFGQNYKPVNPHGDFYLTRQEKLALGHGRQVAFTVPMRGEHDEDAFR